MVVEGALLLCCAVLCCAKITTLGGGGGYQMQLEGCTIKRLYLTMLLPIVEEECDN